MADRTLTLAALTAEVMGEKKVAAKSLTPVEGEGKPGPLPTTKAMFPNDMPSEVVQQKADELTRIIGHLTEARDALLTLVDEPLPAEVVDLDAERKEREREADERAALQAGIDSIDAAETIDDAVEAVARFNRNFNSQKEAAQAAVFEEGSRAAKVLEASREGIIPVEEILAKVGGWVCPEHGKRVEKTSAKTKKTFIGCPECSQFER